MGCFYCSIGVPDLCLESAGVEGAQAGTLSARVALSPRRLEKIGQEVTEVVLRNVLEERAEEYERGRSEQETRALRDFDELVPVDEGARES